MFFFFGRGLFGIFKQSETNKLHFTVWRPKTKDGSWHNCIGYDMGNGGLAGCQETANPTASYLLVCIHYTTPYKLKAMGETFSYFWPLSLSFSRLLLYLVIPDSWSHQALPGKCKADLSPPHHACLIFYQKVRLSRRIVTAGYSCCTPTYICRLHEFIRSFTRSHSNKPYIHM